MIWGGGRGNDISPLFFFFLITVRRIWSNTSPTRSPYRLQFRSSACRRSRFDCRPRPPPSRKEDNGKCAENVQRKVNEKKDGRRDIASRQKKKKIAHGFINRKTKQRRTGLMGTPRTCVLYKLPWVITTTQKRPDRNAEGS